MSPEITFISDLLIKAAFKNVSPDESRLLEAFANRSGKNRELLRSVSDKTILWKNVKKYSTTDNDAVFKLVLMKKGFPENDKNFG